MGDDYIGKRYTGDHLPIDVIYTTRSHNWSTTKIKDLITIQTIKQNPDIINRVENDNKEYHHLPISIMTKWIIDEKLNEQELGRRLREHYWDVRDELRNEK